VVVSAINVKLVLKLFTDTLCCLELMEMWAVMKMVLLSMKVRKPGETGLLLRGKAFNTALLV
jgi:hypothetical protein